MTQPTHDLKTKPTDAQLCSLAEEYVLQDYARPGDCTFFWEEWDDPLDDTTAHIAAASLPPSAGSYSWIETLDCKVLQSQVVERDDKAGEYAVQVDAEITLTSSGSEESDEAGDAAPEPREIFCYLEFDDDGLLYVSNAHE